MRVREVLRLWGVVFLAAALPGCGGGGGSSSSSTPTTPTPQNRAPTVTATGNLTFGIAQITTFSFSASASDPEGDPVTIAWNFGDGTAGSGTAVTHTYTNGGSMSVIATASDNKGASTPSTAVNVTVGGMTGQWSGTVDLNVCLPGVVKPTTASLTQNGTSITGTVTLAQGLCSFQPGTAVTDPAEPGTIDGNGNVKIRVKIPPFTDVYFQGTMDTTGRKITGGLRGSGHNGTPFVWNKQ